MTHSFACLLAGYPDWYWAVTLVRASRARTATINEVVLLPSAEALLAPAWVPWEQRIQAGDIGPGMLMATPDNDPRLEPGSPRRTCLPTPTQRSGRSCAPPSPSWVLEGNGCSRPSGATPRRSAGSPVLRATAMNPADTPPPPVRPADISCRCVDRSAPCSVPVRTSTRPRMRAWSVLNTVVGDTPTWWPPNGPGSCPPRCSTPLELTNGYLTDRPCAGAVPSRVSGSMIPIRGHEIPESRQAPRELGRSPERILA